ncbi:MAG: protein phosphatase 2C domain-containing protein [Candidatus Brocadiae bacterium]|nr:protein phosphatase 2C domain-containing protein [Candidatus Brocadiia bacterium]
MPLTLKGKSKARLEIQWDGNTPVELSIVPSSNTNTLLYREQILKAGGFQLELTHLEFNNLSEIAELELVALVKSNGVLVEVSEPLSIQKCPHPGCGQWSHAREDGYCKHCGRRIRDQASNYGFAKLEISHLNVLLWNGVEGQLWKKREAKEYSNGIYSIGKYEDKTHPRAYVEILEEKYDPKAQKRFIQLLGVLKEANLLDKSWKPPLACFQEEQQRTIWIYYPWLPKQSKWESLSALSYIVSENIEPLTIKEIAQIGIKLCDIAKKIRSLGYSWGGLKLTDLILCRDNPSISIYLRSKEIAWEEVPPKILLDSCLIPWELFWESNGNENALSEATEVYVIAAVLYLLKAKSPNLLSYNAISYHHGLPSLKLFKPVFMEKSQKKDFASDHFESVINQALLLDPQERGYQTLQELKTILENLLLYGNSPMINRNYFLDVGYTLDVGDEKHEDDLTQNQDAVFSTCFTLRKKKWGIFVLCDGISTSTIGTGDLASRVIINTFRRWWKSTTEEEKKGVCEYASTDIAKAQEFFSNIIHEANQKIYKEAEKIAGKDGLENALIMGSTITAGMIHDGVMFFCWLGDSPIYRISPFGWERLNFEDNEKNSRILKGTPLEECFVEGGNALTRCIGAHFYLEQKLDIHFGYAHLYPGEQILICSDGIPDYIEQEASYARYENYQMLRIASVIQQYEKEELFNAKALSSILLSSVNRIGGGYDNLSAILINTIPESSLSFEKSYQKLRSLSPGMKKILKEANLDTKEAKTMKLPRL